MAAEEAAHDEELQKGAPGRSHQLQRKVRTPRMRAGADTRRFSQIIGVKLPAPLDDKLTVIYQQVTDLSPLPPDFDYGHMFESYIWRAIFLTSFTLGIRFGNIELISSLFMGLLGSFIVFIIAYVLVPAGIVYVDSQAEKRKINIYERRITLIGVAALLGVLGSVMNQHYIIKHQRPPSYFLPGLISITVQVVGPRFANNRVHFIAVSVGSAYVIGVMIMAFFHDIYFSTLLDLTVSAVLATINLQIIVAAIKAHKANIMAGHVTAVLMALYQHLVFSRTLGEYKEDEKAAPSIASPILYS